MQNKSVSFLDPWASKDSVDALSKRLAARQPASVFGAMRHARMVYADDAFVRTLSKDARAYLNTLPTPPATASGDSAQAAAVPAVPPDLAIEIFAFANATLLQDMQAPAVDAMMHNLRIPQALTYLYTAVTELPYHDDGYQLLLDRCAAWLGQRFNDMRHNPTYRWRPHAEQAIVDGALHAHVDHALRDGTQSQLRKLEDLVQHRIEQGKVPQEVLDKPHVWSWLCCDAPVSVWHALEQQGTDLGALATQTRALAFRQATKAGRHDLMSLMLQATAPAKRDILWTAVDQDAFALAIADENHQTLHALLGHLGLQERKEMADCFDAWEAAARSPNRHMLEVMHAWLPQSAASEFEVLIGLIEGHHPYRVHRMLADAPNAASLLTREHYMAFHFACTQGDATMIHTFLSHAALKLDTDRFAAMLRVGFCQVACATTSDSASVEKLMGWLEGAAAPRGIDLFEGFGHSTLARVCQAGHVEVVRRVLQRSDVRTHAAWLDMPANIDRRHPTLLTAACRKAQHAVVDALFKWAESISEPSAMLLHNRGAALLAATQSGDAALVERLTHLAQQAPEDWQAWLSRRFLVTLRHAVACNTPKVLQTWLRLISPQQLCDALQLGLLVQEALHTGAHHTLDALFKTAEATDPQLVAHMLHEALRADPEGDVPLGTAWRHGDTKTADTVLSRLTPSRYKAALKLSFEDLCKTDGTYFLRHWCNLDAAEQSQLLTNDFWAQLPTLASPDVALYFVEHDQDAFIRALSPLPDFAFSERAAKAVEAVVHVLPADLQQRVVATWGASILAEALENEHEGMWMLAQHLPDDVIWRLLLPHEEAIRSRPYGHVARQALTRLVLERTWHSAPEIAPLGEMAREMMIEDDNINLLRELVATHPDVLQEDGMQRLLHPYNPEWAIHRPNIADYLLDRRYQSTLAQDETL